MFEICDRGTVLRDGEYIDTVDLAQVTEEDIIRLMVGRNLDQQYPKVASERGEEALRVEGLNREGVLHDISFTAYAGEILGIAGLVGAGRTELMRAVFGADPITSGRVYIFGKETAVKSPQVAIRAGVGLLPEDRKQQGLVLMLSVLHNMSMASLDRLTSNLLLRKDDERKQANGFVDKLRIATPGINQQVQYLSGGNQQKVVLAKWLASQSESPHLRRAHPRHRRRGQGRDLQPDEQPGRKRRRGHHDLLRDAGAARHERPDSRHARGPHRGGAEPPGSNPGESAGSSDGSGQR